MPVARDWPLETVEIACKHCGRFGRYSKARFVELVGADTDLTIARRKLAADCPVWLAKPDVTTTDCKPRYVQEWWRKSKWNRC